MSQTKRDEGLEKVFDTIIDPHTHQSISKMRLTSYSFKNGHLNLILSPTSPFCPFIKQMGDQVKEKLKKYSAVKSFKIVVHGHVYSSLLNKHFARE